MAAKTIETICDELIHRVEHVTFWDTAEPNTTFYDEIIDGLKEIRAMAASEGIAGSLNVQNRVEDDLVGQLRELAIMTPPICRHETGNTGPVFCKPFEQFQLIVKTAADEIERLRGGGTGHGS